MCIFDAVKTCVNKIHDINHQKLLRNNVVYGAKLISNILSLRSQVELMIIIANETGSRQGCQLHNLIDLHLLRTLNNKVLRSQTVSVLELSFIILFFQACFQNARRNARYFHYSMEFLLFQRSESIMKTCVCIIHSKRLKSNSAAGMNSRFGNCLRLKQ